MSETNKEWELYEKGKKFCNRIEPNYFKTIETNLDFYTGNQWRNVKSNGMPTPVFNLIKRALQFFVSSICSQAVSISYEALEGRDDDLGDSMNIARVATSEVRNLFDKFKMDNKIREALTDAGVMGDVAAHMYFNYDKKPYGGALGADYQGEIEFELIDGSNVFFGNPNNSNISTDIQPYIIISGRDSVENLKKEAERYNESVVESIETDRPDDDMAGQYGKVEIEGDKTGKATYIIMYKVVKETVKETIVNKLGQQEVIEKEVTKIIQTKCTENAYMYKDVDTGLSVYPISWLLWEKSKNLYHGRALATGMIPNQIFINRMFAMVMYHLMTAAFPKAVYDQSKVTSWSNEIGVAIPVDGLASNESVRNIATYLDAGNMSSQIVQVIEMAIQHTKDSLGINDNMLGNVKPEQASGRSIVATVQQSQIPLENQKANIYEWIENIGQILLDMMGTYYGERPLLMEVPEPQYDEFGNEIGTDMVKKMVPFDFTVFNDVYLNCKCNVGASSYWSELASVETLTNLFNGGHVDIIDYIESMPDGYIPNKDKLMEGIKARMQEQQMMMAAAPPETMQMPIENNNLIG